MARTNDTYHAVMASPLLSDDLKQIYYVLWTPFAGGAQVEGLTKAEVVANCELNGFQKLHGSPWDKGVATLVKMGLVKKGNKRHCTVKHKEDATWSLTDAGLPVKPKANKPSAKQYIKGIAQFEMLIAQHKSYGDGLITPELEKLYEWVRDKVPEKTL